MAKFRKRPVVVDAFRFGQVLGRPMWLTEAIANNDVIVYPDHAMIRTLEGNMRAELGDWIIQGVKGELYPCKPDIFEATYEPA